VVLAKWLVFVHCQPMNCVAAYTAHCITNNGIEAHMNDELNGRTAHQWRSDLPREAAIDGLCETICQAIPELVCHGDSIAELDANGGLSAVNLARFRGLLDERVVGERVVPNGDGTTWRREYFTYQYDVTRPLRWDGKGPMPAEVVATEPDFGVLDAIYRHELVKHLPRVIE
jgi:hypothetical protein